MIDGLCEEKHPINHDDDDTLSLSCVIVVLCVRRKEFLFSTATTSSHNYGQTTCSSDRTRCQLCEEQASLVRGSSSSRAAVLTIGRAREKQRYSAETTDICHDLLCGHVTNGMLGTSFGEAIELSMLATEWN